MNNTIAGNELADTLELLLLDLAEGQPSNEHILSHWSYHISTTQTQLQQLVQDGLAAIQLYRERTGTQRVRPAAAVVRD